MVPSSRIRITNTEPTQPQRRYVLYWMIATRRPGWSFGLQYAAEQAAKQDKPLLVFEPLRCGYPWASARLHRFILDGMQDHAKHFASTPAAYFPYVEPAHGAGKGLLSALAKQATLVVTDEFPTFFIPRMVAAAAQRLDVQLAAVDSNGLLPLSSTEAEKTTAHSFRRLFQKTIRPHLLDLPEADPLSSAALAQLERLPEDVTRRWAPTDLDKVDLTTLPIDQDVKPVPGVKGGHLAAQARWRTFKQERMGQYAANRNRVDVSGTSGLSPYLHFGHISAHQIFAEITRGEGWTPAKLPEKASGSRAGWWGMSESAEALLDQVLTWREVGYHFCHHRSDHAEFTSLPAWAQKTLREHADDPRPHTYTLAQLELAETHDPLWNAAQNQLRQTGTIHNYLRMLWGKKILEWSPSPQDAMHVMIELNNKYALDGRDPNSYSSIFWVLGRFDRAWGPERKIFGKIRYMSSDSTRRKLKVKDYIQKWNAPLS